MPSSRAIRDAFAALISAGIQPPSPMKQEELPRRLAAIASVSATWEVILHDVDDTELRELICLHMAQSAWWPRPADLRALLQRFEPPTPAIATGDEAWGRALELIGRHGVYQGAPKRLSEQPEEHEALDAAIRAVGGWGRMCAIRLDDMQARAAFARAYEATRERQRQGAETSRMLGDMAPGLMARLGALMREPTRGLPGPAGGGEASEGRPQGERGAGGALPRDGGGE